MSERLPVCTGLDVVRVGFGERREIAISAVTLEEIHLGLSARPNPRVLALFTAFVAEHCHVLPITGEIARVAGEMRATRNVRDFAGCGVTLINPFA